MQSLTYYMACCEKKLAENLLAPYKFSSKKPVAQLALPISVPAPVPLLDVNPEENKTAITRFHAFI